MNVVLIASLLLPLSDTAQVSLYQAPRIEMRYPADGAELPAHTKISISARVSDPNGVAAVEMIWRHTERTLRCPGGNNRDWNCRRDGDLYTWTLDAGTGNREYQVRARDTRGNLSVTPVLRLQFRQPPDIVFVSERNGRRQIYGIQADGTGERRYVLDDAPSYAPAFSADGTQLAFVSERDGTPHLYVMTLATGEVRRLTSALGVRDDHPSWRAGISQPTPGPLPQPGNFRIHRHRSTPLSDTTADRYLADAREVLEGVDGPGDVATVVDLRRDGPVRVFTIGDGLVNRKAEKDSIMRSPGHVYVVNAVHFCGDSFNASAIGCAGRGTPLLVAHLEASAQRDGILWIHEYGHNRGIGHRPRTGAAPHIYAVMYPSLSPQRRRVNQAEHDDYVVPLASLELGVETDEQPEARAGVPEDVQSFVRELYPHGIPYEEATRLPRTAVPVLLGMLEDPAEAQYWANIVTTLGMIGDTLAVEPLIRFVESENNVDGQSLSEYRAKLAVAPALGYILAKQPNGRAFSYLRDAAMPAFWSQRLHAQGVSLVPQSDWHVQLAETAIWGLALSGSPEAGRVLNDFKSKAAIAVPGFGPASADLLAEASSAHAVIAAGGLAAYYAAGEQ